jgi:hypothetical protein
LKIEMRTYQVTVANTVASVAPYNRFGAYTITPALASNEKIIAIYGVANGSNIPTPCGLISDGRIVVTTEDGRLTINVTCTIAILES